MYIVITMKPTRPSITHTKYLVKLPGPVLPINQALYHPAVWSTGPVLPIVKLPDPVLNGQTTRPSITHTDYLRS